MTKLARLALEPSQASGSEPATTLATIHLDLDQVPFPDARWTDFAIPVTAWFAEAATYLLSGGAEEQVVHFMEGPYRVRLSSQPSGTWHITLIRSGARMDHVVDEGDVDRGVLTRSIVEVAEALLASPAHPHGSQRDTYRLQGLLLRLRTAMQADPT